MILLYNKITNSKIESNGAVSERKQMKTQLILLLYDTLLFSKRVLRREFCDENSISERTFYRYIKEIGLFLMHNKCNYIINVDETTGVYYLEKCE